MWVRKIANEVRILEVLPLITQSKLEDSGFFIFSYSLENGNGQTEEKNSESEIKQNSFFTKPESLEKLYGSWKWLSDIPTEIIILTSKIKFTEQILQAMEGNIKEQERKLKVSLNFLKITILNI